jgi:hypothetical protein
MNLDKRYYMEDFISDRDTQAWLVYLRLRLVWGLVCAK